MQFGDARLEDFRRASGRSFTKEEFRQNSDLQREVEEWHIGDIGRFVQRNGLEGYVGANIAGVPVTPAGMIWAAHIGGKGGMKKFLESGGRYNPADSNGTTIAEYMRRGAERG